MLKVAASEFVRNFSRLREVIQREPVAVTNHDRITGVLLSPKDFEEYQALKQQAAKAVWAYELSDETLSALGEVRMDSRHAELDGLMGD